MTRVNDPTRELNEPPAAVPDLERGYEYPGAGCDAEGGERPLLSWNHLVAWLLLGRVTFAVTLAATDVDARDKCQAVQIIPVFVPRSLMNNSLSAQHLAETGQEL